MSRTFAPHRISRRRFVGLGAAVSAFGAVSARFVDAQPPPPGPLGPYLARPGRTEMSIWMESDDGPPRDVEAHRTPRRGRTLAPFVEIERGLYLATLTGLDPDSSYSYRFADSRGKVHSSTFRTLPSERGIATVIVGADIHPWSAPHTTVDRITERRPHLYVGLGDQVYSDSDPETVPEPTVEGYEHLYRRSWSYPSIARLFGSVPAALVWDDHEIWNDYDGSDHYDRFVAARAAYRRFQRSRSRGATPWSIVSVGAAEIFMLDTRSHRDPNAAPDGPDKTMLGIAQRDALIHFLATSRARLRIVASPTPFHRHVTTGRDAWAHAFSVERQIVFDAIDAHDPRTVLVLSGDQHWPGAFEHPLASGSHVVELQCTPTSAFVRPPPETLGPEVLYADGDHEGYGVLVIDGTGPEVRTRFAWTDASGRERFVLEHPTMPRPPTTAIEEAESSPV